MHELSIALSIVDMVEDETTRLGGRRVAAVHLRIGRLSGIVHDALRSSYELATAETALAGTRLIIEDVPVLVRCPLCDAPRGIRSIQEFCCVECGTPGADVITGRELVVSALEIRS